MFKLQLHDELTTLTFLNLAFTKEIDKSMMDFEFTMLWHSLDMYLNATRVLYIYKVETLTMETG